MKDGIIEIPPEANKARPRISIPLHPALLVGLGGGGAGLAGTDGTGLVLSDSLDYQKCNREFQAGIKKAGVDPATRLHDLRRTFVAWLAEKGTPQWVVMRLGGWTSSETLRKHYQCAVPAGALRGYLDAI